MGNITIPNAVPAIENAISGNFNTGRRLLVAYFLVILMQMNVPTAEPIVTASRTKKIAPIITKTSNDISSAAPYLVDNYCLTFWLCGAGHESIRKHDALSPASARAGC